MNAKDLEALLHAKLKTIHLDVVDESQKHVGHSQAQGGGHYRAVIVSETFEGKGTLERHRMVYAAVAMPNPEIHALALTTLTPSEWEKKKR